MIEGKDFNYNYVANKEENELNMVPVVINRTAYMITQEELEELIIAVNAIEMAETDEEKQRISSASVELFDSVMNNNRGMDIDHVFYTPDYQLELALEEGDIISGSGDENGEMPFEC